LRTVSAKRSHHTSVGVIIHVKVDSTHGLLAHIALSLRSFCAHVALQLVRNQTLFPRKEKRPYAPSFLRFGLRSSKYVQRYIFVLPIGEGPSDIYWKNFLIKLFNSDIDRTVYVGRNFDERGGAKGELKRPCANYSRSFKSRQSRGTYGDHERLARFLFQCLLFLAFDFLLRRYPSPWN
jgi:hypothetical protein